MAKELHLWTRFRFLLLRLSVDLICDDGDDTDDIDDVWSHSMKMMMN